MINRSLFLGSIQKRCLQTHPVLEVPPEAMKDRARALISLISAERNLAYGDHRIFLRHLCRLFPDIEVKAREIVTKAARELHGKKGLMVHQVYQPQKPSIEQSVEVDPELINGPADFVSCLKGITKRLVVCQSNPSNGNVAMLISLANTPALIETCLKVMRAQRWHLRAGHEPLSLQFFTQAIKIWPIEEAGWDVRLGDLLESAVAKASNYAALLTPKVLIAAVDAITNRIVYGPKDQAEQAWAWCALAIKLLNASETYCGPCLDSHTEICKSYLNLFAHASNSISPDAEFKLPHGVGIQEFLLGAIESTLTPEVLPLIDPFSLSCALKAFVRAGKAFPDFLTAFLRTQESYLRLFSAIEGGKVNEEALAQLKVPSDPQGHHLNVLKFLKGTSSVEGNPEQQA